ncbi:uncharacterized protein LOC131680512 [Topomyia yanbarensis]|uniref:uncharacterized protein LOC131680512 n=1 Tax=Topomyia yanbarensis TaxID=2498891 RepID=UPI00273C1C51|nr:uncharacterized protein LOC131680512 [Topomyia yanbarensis]
MASSVDKTFVINFKVVPTKLNFPAIAEFITKNLAIEATQLQHLQVSNGRVFVGTDSAQTAQDIVQEHNLKHQVEHDGKSYSIPLSMEDGSVEVRVHDLRPSTSNRQLAYRMRDYGEIISIRDEVWKDFFPGIPNGVRIMRIKLTKPIPSYVMVDTTMTLVTYKGQVATCKHCNRRVHYAQKCSEYAKSSKPSVSGRLTLAEIVKNGDNRSISQQTFRQPNNASSTGLKKGTPHHGSNISLAGSETAMIIESSQNVPESRGQTPIDTISASQPTSEVNTVNLTSPFFGFPDENCTAAVALGCYQAHNLTNNMPPQNPTATATYNSSSRLCKKEKSASYVPVIDVILCSQKLRNNTTKLNQQKSSFSSVSFMGSMCPAEAKNDATVFSEFRPFPAAVAATACRRYLHCRRKKNITIESPDTAVIHTNDQTLQTLTIRDDKSTCYPSHQHSNKLDLQTEFLAALCICPVRAFFDTAILSKFSPFQVLAAVTASNNNLHRRRTKKIYTVPYFAAASASRNPYRCNNIFLQAPAAREEISTSYFSHYHSNKLNLQAALLAALVSILDSICPAEAIYDTATLSKFPPFPALSATAVPFIIYTFRRRDSKKMMEAPVVCEPTYVTTASPRNFSSRRKINKKCKIQYTVVAITSISYSSRRYTNKMVLHALTDFGETLNQTDLPAPPSVSSLSLLLSSPQAAMLVSLL